MLTSDKKTLMHIMTLYHATVAFAKHNVSVVHVNHRKEDT